MEKVTLDTIELANLLNISRSTVYTMVRFEEIPFFKVRGKIMFNRELIMAWTRGEVELSEETIDEI